MGRFDFHKASRRFEEVRRVTFHNCKACRRLVEDQIGGLDFRKACRKLVEVRRVLNFVKCIGGL